MTELLAALRRRRGCRARAASGKDGRVRETWTRPNRALPTTRCHTTEKMEKGWGVIRAWEVSRQGSCHPPEHNLRQAPRDNEHDSRASHSNSMPCLLHKSKRRGKPRHQDQATSDLHPSHDAMTFAR